MVGSRNGFGWISQSNYNKLRALWTIDLNVKQAHLVKYCQNQKKTH